MKAAILAMAVLAAAGTVLYFSAATNGSKAGLTGFAASGAVAPALAWQPDAMGFAQRPAVGATAFSLPLFFEPNQGQSDDRVKFLAHGSGYGLFLTADEAVLTLQHSAVSAMRPLGGRRAPLGSERVANSVIRMRLEGASASARVSGASPLPGMSSYFIGNNSSKWRTGIPQFARVEYRGIYPGVDLVYYGDGGKLEYDFRVAPGADPNRIALSFAGAAARIDGEDSGDLILSTGQGDVRFHAPRIYQPAAPGVAEKAVAGGFRQLTGKKIGFFVGSYDRSRELVIDPILSYSSYLGGSGTVTCPTAAPGQGCPLVAVDSAGNIYLAGSTTSQYFFPTDLPNTPYSSTLVGTQNIFIAVLNPTLTPTQQLLYATYIGGSGTDSLAGLAVDGSFSIYVAGTTNSTNYPTTSNAFQGSSPGGTHGFLSKLAFPTAPASQIYALAYSTYLEGNGVDTVTGLAVDNNENAYLTGDTTSDNAYNQSPGGGLSAGFPANASGFQLQSNAPGQPQFFASMIDTGTGAMAYSTYFGGGLFAAGADVALNQGGGIAIDPPLSTNTPNMYFTGTTNMLPSSTSSSTPGFPLYNAQQSCLNQASVIAPPCGTTDLTNTDAFIAKINPTEAGAPPVYSTYLGGGNNDNGYSVAVDTSGNSYVTGLTFSSDWACTCASSSEFQSTNNGNGDAFIVKLGTEAAGSSIPNPITYFTYLGGTQQDAGTGIQVDPNQAVHVSGVTFSSAGAGFPIANPLEPQTAPPSSYNGGAYGGAGDAFVALISTTSGATEASPLGDYVTYLGGSGLDQGSGIALDSFYSTYVAGSTVSTNFPLLNAYQNTLAGTQDAFVSKIGANSVLDVLNASGSPSPSPVAKGTQAAFTFNIMNAGPDNAFDLVFQATAPSSGLSSAPTAIVTAGTGNCSAAIVGTTSDTVPCNITSLAAGSTATVEVDVTSSIAAFNLNTISVGAQASANGGPFVSDQNGPQTDSVTDFTISATAVSPSVTAGGTGLITITFCPSNPTLGYSATVTPSQSTSPSMVTSPSPTFNPTSVSLSGSACQTTTLSIPTVARPVGTGGLLRPRRSHYAPFYATWLPIAGLSLIGLGMGAGRKRRRWLVGAVLGLLAGLILWLPACSSPTTTITTQGGTAAGIYIVTITGSAGTGVSHNTQVELQVN